MKPQQKVGENICSDGSGQASAHVAAPGVAVTTPAPTRTTASLNAAQSEAITS